MKRILSVLEAVAACHTAEYEGKTVVFTNGCMDVLHPGHIRALEKARSLGDILIVGLNSDASVRALKGEGRPINDQNFRATMLAALRCVDMVVIFDEPTPLELIKRIQPDVLVKGGDHQRDTIVGKAEVEAAGGVVVTVPTLPGYSTTGIVEKIRKG